jgi:prepilin-type N-terminal cleavage/methylation domain-containing protein
MATPKNSPHPENRLRPGPPPRPGFRREHARVGGAPKAAARPGPAQLAHCGGFTLAEMMVAMFIFVIMVLAVIYIQIFGLRYDELTCSKLGADEQSRMAFNDLVYDIRSSKVWAVGTGSATGFQPNTNAVNQAGNAIQLCASFSSVSNGVVDTNGWIRYFFDTNHYLLCRMTNNGTSQYSIVCSNLTNAMLFQGVNYNGSNQCDLAYKWAISTCLQFSQYQFPLTYVGPSYYYNYYQIRFVIAPHNYDPPP